MVLATDIKLFIFINIKKFTFLINLIFVLVEAQEVIVIKNDTVFSRVIF